MSASVDPTARTTHHMVVLFLRQQEELRPARLRPATGTHWTTIERRSSSMKDLVAELRGA
jgi:hypothetical protein